MKRCFSGVMATLLMAVACQTEKMDSLHEYGILDVAISNDRSFDVVVKSQVTLSGADAADYNISIFTDSDVLKYGPVDYRDFKSQILPLGTYYVTAESCTPKEAEVGNGQMRMAGTSADVVLTPSAISQTAKVECYVANAKFVVEYDSSISGMFEDLKVEVSGGTTSGRKVVFGETQAGQQTEAWFNPSTITYTISGKFIPTGNDMTITDSRVLAAKDDVLLLVKLNLDNGEISACPEIVVDVTMNEQVTVEKEFNPYGN